MSNSILEHSHKQEKISGPPRAAWKADIFLATILFYLYRL